MLFTVSLLNGIGCTNAVCERPLDKFCTDCPTLEEAIARVEARKAGPYDDVISVWECADGEHVLVSTATHAFSGSWEYYSIHTGELVGVRVWDEGMAWCLREGVGEFGLLPRMCDPVCTIAQYDDCTPDAECEPYALKVPMCQRSTGDTGS